MLMPSVPKSEITFNYVRTLFSLGLNVLIRKYFFILVLEAADDTYSVMDDYALSLNQCWASKTNTVTDHAYDSAEGHILLWDEFCPEFPWVGPLAYSSGSLPTHVSSWTAALDKPTVEDKAAYLFLRVMAKM